jgi:histidinol phosphatase-like PHP family hydrolase
MARRLDRLADLAAAADVALEVNGSDVRVYPELVQLLCESIARAGAPLSLGSDAHRPHSVGAVLRGIDAVRAAGVRSAVAFERRERRDYPL